MCIRDRFDAGFVTQSDEPGRDAQQSVGASLRASYTGLAAGELLSITSVADSDIVYSFDGDWGNPEFWGSAGPFQFFSETQRQRLTISQELRLVSDSDSALFSGTTDWVVGLYGLHLEEDNQIEDIFNSETFRELNSEYTATNLALFGQLDTQLSARDNLSFGLRVENRDARYRDCLLYTSPSPRDLSTSRMPSSA